MIHTGDCIEVMAGMPADSVDSICTDPPYGLGFMGKKWDSPTGRASWTEAGGPLGIDHKLTTDRSGSMKAGKSFMEWCEAWGREALRVTKPGGYLLAFGGTRTHHRLVCGLEDAGWIIRDELDWIYASGFPKGKANLKPAHEPIVLARKPGPLRPLAIYECRIQGPAWSKQDGDSGAGFRTGKFMGGAGVGEPTQQGGFRESAAGRWPSNLLLSDPELFDVANPYVVGSGAVTSVPATYQSQPKSEWQTSSYPGSPPGDLVEGYGDSGGYSRFFIVPKADRADREPEYAISQGMAPGGDVAGVGALRDGGRPSMPRANQHPTVKPVDLMRHLVRLVTPVGGTVLDPFLGSGSTAIACELEGFPWIGIEKEPEYVAIAEARLNGTQRGLGLAI